MRPTRASATALTGADGPLRQPTKLLVEAVLEDEMIEHLWYDKGYQEGRNPGNLRNGNASHPVRGLPFCWLQHRVANVGEQPEWRRFVGQGVVAAGGVLGVGEGACGVHEDGHVVVGVVAEPGADAGGGVVAGLFPGSPHGFESDDGFG